MNKFGVVHTSHLFLVQFVGNHEPLVVDAHTLDQNISLTQSGTLSANVFVTLCMLFEIKTFILSISTGTFGNKVILFLGTAFILGNTSKSMCIASVCFLDCGHWMWLWLLW